MAEYYYLMAQLPPVDISSPPPFSSFEQFKELALRYLNKKDARILRGISEEPPRKYEKTGSAFLDGWYEFERSLRLELRAARAAKLKWDVSPMSFEEYDILNKSYSPVKIARAAASMEDPLQAELFLNEERFIAADIIRGAEAFSSDAVFSYAVMLMLSLRAAKFSKEKGAEAYRKLYDGIFEARPRHNSF